jgi:cobalamin biosynthesis Mg chelatase CobN
VGIALIVVLVLAVLLPFPVGSYAFNGYLEDCDFDGYDDETGKPVPFYGFDETKGDKVPADWDGVAGSYVFKSETPKTTTPTTPTTGGSKSNTSTSNNTTTNAPASGSSATNAPAGNASSNASTGNSSSSNATSKSSAKSADTAVNETAEVNEVPIELDEVETPISELSEAVAAVVSVKGKLDVKAAEGEAFYPGAEVTIEGENFAGNVDDLDIEIHSEKPQLLYTVQTGADGSFEAKVQLPDDLELGKHDVVVLYQGNPIVKKTIEVAEQAAPAEDSGVNIAGFILLAVIVILAAALLLFRKIRKSKAGEQTSEESA